jgi:gamma-glutamyltranspeptidase/glutathione hydrolase
MNAHPELVRRAVASGTLGAVAAGTRPAAVIGTAVLLQGGNAFDAAIAAALAETVLLPSKCGLAGDVVALFISPDQETPTSVLSIGRAPLGLYAAAEASGWAPASTGPLSVGVPGAPAGYAALAARGRLGLAALTAPAIALARRGIVWSAVNQRLAAESADLLRRYQPDGCRYAPAAGPIGLGRVLRLPGLADLLTGFATAGADLFTGPIGDQICAYVASLGGVLSTDDLVPVAAEQAPADAVDLTDGPVWATNGPSYGTALLDVLATGVSAGTVRTALTRLREPAGRSPALIDGTSTVAAVDAEGNAVVLVHSNSFPQYGSGLVVPGLDLVLSNRAGRGFTFAPDHPNAPVAGRRPLTTLHAWALKDADDSWVLGATPGGEQQVPWNAQVLDRIVHPRSAGPMDLARAVAAPHWELDQTGTTIRETVELPPYGARSSHTVVRMGTDLLTAVADPRGDAAAVAA